MRSEEGRGVAWVGLYTVKVMEGRSRRRGRSEEAGKGVLSVARMVTVLEFERRKRKNATKSAINCLKTMIPSYETRYTGKRSFIPLLICIPVCYIK